MSTLSSLYTAYSGLTAAKAALEVTGQNISNVNTTGYSRQRVDQSALVAVAGGSISGTTTSVGAGVQVNSIQRVSDALINSQVRTTASSAGYWSTTASALSTVETSLNEPSDNGLSNTLSTYWNAWQAMATNAGTTSSASSAAASLISAGTAVASALKTGYTTAATSWNNQQQTASGDVDTLNNATQQVAKLNQQIYATTAAGGNANELMDQRDTALTTISTMTGAATRNEPNGMVDVVIGGHTVVSGTTAATLKLTGSTTLQGASTSPVGVAVVGSGGTTTALSLDGGQIAAEVASLQGANASGTGGVFAQQAQLYNTLASTISSQVNAIANSSTAQSSSGATNLPFFGTSDGSSTVTALNLTVVPTSVSQIATATTSEGAAGNSIATQIANIGTAGYTGGATGVPTASPDSVWSSYVAGVGTQSAAATNQSTLAASASTAATTSQTSASGVDLDEETSNLVIYQHAYQGAARVMTTIDQMLDTLINNTGLVGRA